MKTEYSLIEILIGKSGKNILDKADKIVETKLSYDEKKIIYKSFDLSARVGVICGGLITTVFAILYILFLG